VAVRESIESAKQWLDRALLEIEALEARVEALSNQDKPVEQDDTTEHAEDDDRLAWGSKVSPVFKERVRWIAENLGCPPNSLMACMAWESGETFRADIKNAAGSGATGLIQFMPSTARALGTTTSALAKMTPEDQLNYVYKYFQPYAGRLHNLGDVYMAILWPKGVEKPDHYVLFDKKKMPKTFRQNAGLDVNKDGLVTRAECLVKVNEKLAKGLQPHNVG
jgi:hypothetical protein